MAQGGTKNKNKNQHNRGGNNPGYGPGSGRGFKGAGIGGDVGGFGKPTSDKNLSGQGGKNPFGDKGFGDKGNLSLSGLATFFSNLLAGASYADAMGQATGLATLRKDLHPNYIKRMEGLNLDVTNPKEGLKWTIDNQVAINNIKNEKVRNYLNKVLPKAIKDWKINHQMHYTPKIKPGDPRWTPQGTGKGPKLDKNTEKYFEWLARANPEGKTISDYNKLYKKQLDSGMDLFTAMKFNPAETGNFYALIDDTKKAEEKALDKQYKNDQAIYNNNKKNMSVTISKGSENKSTTGPNTTDKDWLKGAYKKAFGPDREANFDAKGGAQYWLDQMASNPTSHSRDEVMRMLKGSDEGKKYAASGVTMPGGVDPNKSIHSQFGTGNTWLEHWAPGGSLAPDNIDNTFTDVNKSLSTINPNASYTNFDDNTFKPGGPNPDIKTPPGTIHKDGWWSKFADADAFKKFLLGDQQKSDGMGDFMKFMMLMNVMRPGGGGGWGGGGGSQFGYGGLNPGGVQAAYDPMKSLQGMGTWFKDNFGSGSGTTTSTVNTN